VKIEVIDVTEEDCKAAALENLEELISVAYRGGIYNSADEAVNWLYLLGYGNYSSHVLLEMTLSELEHLFLEVKSFGE